ncbi:ground-like domain protein [Cooperia oncophora]
MYLAPVILALFASSQAIFFGGGGGGGQSGGGYAAGGGGGPYPAGGGAPPYSVGGGAPPYSLGGAGGGPYPAGGGAAPYSAGGGGGPYPEGGGGGISSAGTLSDIPPPPSRSSQEPGAPSASASDTEGSVDDLPSSNSIAASLTKQRSENIVREDAVASKRAIHDTAIKIYPDFTVDVICSSTGFTYLVSTTEHCEAQKDNVICFVYKRPLLR